MPDACRRARRARIRNRSGGRLALGKSDAQFPLKRSKEIFQPDAQSDLPHLGPGLRPGRCGWVGSPEGVGRGSRNPRPPPLAQRSARRSKLNSGRCSCFHPTTGRPYGPARPFERSFLRFCMTCMVCMVCMVSISCIDWNVLHGLHDLHGFIYPAWSERFA